MRERHRSQETKERFKKAFFALYAEKKIEKITIPTIGDILIIIDKGLVTLSVLFS